MTDILRSTSDSETDRLRAAWALFDKKDWSAAAAMFEAVERASVNEPTIGSVEAGFGLAHTCVRLADYTAMKGALERAMAGAAGRSEIMLALSRAWIPRNLLGYAIDVTKMGWDKPDAASVPRRLEWLRTLGKIYTSAGDIGGALSVHYAVLSIEPHEAVNFANVGRLWMTAQNNAKAGNFFQKALARDSRCLPALDGLADIAWLEGNTEIVRDLMAKRVQLSSDPAERAAALFKAAAAQPVVANDDDEIDQARTRFMNMLAAGPTAPLADPVKHLLGPNFYVNYQGRDDRALHAAAAAYFLAATPSLGETAPHVHRLRRDGKYRIGMVSNYFNAHTIGYLNRGLIMGIDRARFEVILFRTPGALSDAATQEMSAAAHVVDLPPNLSAARRTIAEAAPDIIHYPEIGMDYFTYFLAFARIAKIQTAGWGHPVSTGIPNIDMFLSVDDMEPPDGEAHYSERLIKLRRLSIDVTRPALDGTALSRADLGLEAGRPAYVCAQSLYKVHHTFDETARAILDRDRDGLIYFISLGPYPDERFIARLQRRLGGDAARVRLLPRVGPQKFLHLLHAADVLLDVPQWSGGKTSLEGFAMGTPIVHQPGAYMRGRHTLAFYRRMDLMPAVVDGSGAYAEAAVRLVHDQEFRREVRGQIAARSDRLFGDREAIREIENVWLDALRNAA